MSGISPSLLHSIKLEQSAPVKELVAFLTLGDGGQGLREAASGGLGKASGPRISTEAGWLRSEP